MSKKFTVLTLETSAEIDGFVRLSADWFSLDPIAQRDLIDDWNGILDELEKMVREQSRGLIPDKPHEVCRNAILGKRANSQVVNARYRKAEK